MALQTNKVKKCCVLVKSSVEEYFLFQPFKVPTTFSLTEIYDYIKENYGENYSSNWLLTDEERDILNTLILQIIQRKEI